jgi:hypothetical protein
MKNVIHTFCFLFSATVLFAQGRILWDESVNGRLATSYTTPTSFGNLATGTNSILGSVEAVPFEFGWIGTNDYFTFQLPDGFQMESASLQINQQILVWLGTANFDNQIGYQVTGTSEELLPYFGGQPLTSGGYSMYLSDQYLQNDPTSVNYRFDFVVSAVPEPGTWALLALGSALFWSFARRRP